jgi:hypothetical protein
VASRIAKIFKLSRCLDELSDRRERAACLFPDHPSRKSLIADHFVMAGLDPAIHVFVAARS